METWKKLSTTEKAMIGFIVILIIMVALNWQHVSKGIKKGIEPYNSQKTEINE